MIGVHIANCVHIRVSSSGGKQERGTFDSGLVAGPSGDMGAYTPKIMSPRSTETKMAKTSIPAAADCNCLVVRQVARFITHFYDQYLAEAGLRTTQYGILAKLKRHGPMSINALAAELVMDRTTLGRNAQPLERDGLIAIEPGPRDRRSKVLRLTRTGKNRFERAHKNWTEAQKRFEDVYGGRKAAELRRSLRAVISSGLGPFDSYATD